MSTSTGSHRFHCFTALCPHTYYATGKLYLGRYLLGVVRRYEQELDIPHALDAGGGDYLVRFLDNHHDLHAARQGSQSLRCTLTIVSANVALLCIPLNSVDIFVVAL